MNQSPAEEVEDYMHTHRVRRDIAFNKTMLRRCGLVLYHCNNQIAKIPPSGLHGILKEQNDVLEELVRQMDTR